MEETYTIKDYLKGKVSLQVEDSVFASIFYDRGVTESTPVSSCSDRIKELCLADLYVCISSMPSKRGSVRDADGNWSHEEGSFELGVSDKNAFRKMANEIYSKYGEKKGVTGGIRFISRGIKIC